MREFFTQDLIPEGIALVAILLLGSLLAFFLKRLLNRMQRAVINWPKSSYAPWLVHTIQVAEAGVRPFAIYLVGYSVIHILQTIEGPTTRTLQ